MRWPWVSREAHEAVVALLEQQQRRDLDALLVERERCDRLQTELARVNSVLVEMKRAGFNPPDKAPAAHQITDPLPPEVAEAISARMEPTGPHGREARRQALVWLSLGTPAADVVRRILDGAEPPE